LTNRGAENFRLVRAPDDAPGEAHWHDVVPERPGVFLADLDAFERHLVLHVRSGGYSNLEVLDLDTLALVPVACEEAAHTVSSQMNPEFHTTVYRYSYTSFVTPMSVYELDLVTGNRSLLKRTEVPGFDPRAYVTEITHATAADGTLVPISVVRLAGRPLDGSSPMLLYGYGSYGISIDPTFSVTRLVLLDRGVTFGIAHVRGGGELGEAWRTAGHLQRKLTTFEDFIAAAEHAIAAGYTSSDRLAIEGGSAGGLLVAAVANMRPDLFTAVVAHVPFVDVVNTMLDASLPLTTGEYLEWGNPNVEADYDYMMRYSPYDNVKAQPYPAMLVKVSMYDSQVPYWEGAKLVAKLRALAPGDRPIFLVTNFGAGHGGASGRYDYLRDVAFDDAFVLSQIVRPGAAALPVTAG
jgi:oligopeptidase B